MSAALSNYLCKILLILADMNEAKSLIEDFAFIRTDKNFYQCRDSHMSIAMDMILLEQWGKDGVIKALKDIKLENYDSCVNLGFAGSCSPDLPLQNFYTINSVSQLSKTTPEQLDSAIELEIIAIPNLPKATLVSAHTPYKHGFHETFQLVDMEGYAIARLCKNHNLRCMMIKIISDYATQEGGEYLKKHRDVLAEKLSYAFTSSIYAIVEASIPSQI
ncbi:nucleosidase,Phosphorylase superfamily [Chlamydia poikilotherma]|uniref:Nucleosidase,Phosphorylase superfamily n=1 Tax=Chlamydia poikilotherma TaxID=1967783 RepID=A0A3B0PZQ1_9CHLA|nr:hypothetical protein [Chlamydia poikilotherma]SYX08865.1 nucleosidase,Phosphorylase superfamily [Chlamydia poikilotherma]